MRISDWSSVVCSSDLRRAERFAVEDDPLRRNALPAEICEGRFAVRIKSLLARPAAGVGVVAIADQQHAVSRIEIRPDLHAAITEMTGVAVEVEQHRAVREIGRASWRERECQYV